MLEKIKKFFEEDIWNLVGQFRGLPGQLVKLMTILFVAGRDFISDKVGIRASALTYYSTLSLVPVLALVFGISKGFGLEDKLKATILESTDQNREIFLMVFNFAENALRNAKGGVVAGIGVVILIYTLLNTISLIEDSFNDVWDVKKARTWLRKFTDYLSITLLAPFLLIFSSSVTVFISANIQNIANRTGISTVAEPAINWGLQLIPFALIWLLFAALYMIMPNTKVKFSSALVAAVIAGSMYQGVEWLYISFQIGVSKYNAIYGSFAALPLFLIWLQTSWNIVLFGAEISYAHQNLNELLLEKKKSKSTPLSRFKYSIIVLKALVTHYSDKVPFVSPKQISEEANIPLHRTLNVLNVLESCNLVVSIDVNNEILYQPARDKDQLNVSFVIESLLGDEGDKLEAHPEIEQLLEQLKTDLTNQSGKKKVFEV